MSFRHLLGPTYCRHSISSMLSDRNPVIRSASALHWRFRFCTNPNINPNDMTAASAVNSEKRKRTKRRTDEEIKARNSKMQDLWRRGSSAVLMCITVAGLYGVYRFHNEYVKPRKKMLREEGLSLDGATRDRMIRDMANKFQQNMRFVTLQNKVISGIDVLESRRFIILYFGVINCQDRCRDILQMIRSSVDSKKLIKSQDSLSILFVDLNIFDSTERVQQYLDDTLTVNPSDRIEIKGLIPKNRETLRELMDSFNIYIRKQDGEGEMMQLEHSNLIYFVDPDGLLYDVLSGQEGLTEEQIVESTYNLLHHSESTFLGKMRNIMSLTFQTATMRQMPDRLSEINPVPR